MIEIARIERSVARFGESFLGRVFTPGVVAYCRAKKNTAESLAARFAAKEAGAKALGTGISRGVSWREFEVRRKPGMRPELHLSGRAAEIAAGLGVKRMSLSLTHSRELSMAVVIAEDQRIEAVGRGLASKEEITAARMENLPVRAGKQQCLCEGGLCQVSRK